MKNIDRIKSMTLEELSDYITAVYLAGKFVEHYKSDPTTYLKYDLTMVNYETWLSEEE